MEKRNEFIPISANKAISIVNANISLNITASLIYPDATLIINSSADGRYSVMVDSVMYNVTVVNGTAKLILNSPLSSGDHKINITADIINYNPFNKIQTLKVINGTILVNATVINATYPNQAMIFVNASVDGNYIVTVDGNDYTVNVVNGTGNITFNRIAANNYTVTIKRNLANYNPVNVIYNLTISKNTPNINVTVVDVIYPNVVAVNITGDVDGTYVLRIGNKINETTLTAGVSKIVTIGGLAANEVGYVVNVTYAETQNYTAAFNDTRVVKVFRASSSVNASSVVVVYGDVISIDVTAFNASGVVWEIYSGSVCVLNGTSVISNNVTVISGIDLAAGNYSIKLTTVVDANHTSVVNSSSTLNITKYTPKIIVTVVDVVYPNIVYVNVTTDVSGTYNVRIGDKFTSDELIAGVSKLIPIIGLDANEIGYNVDVVYDETQNYTDAFNDINTVRVFKADSSVSASSNIVVYGDRIVIDITAVNASSVSWEVKNGTATVLSGISPVTGIEANISDIKLPVGNYTIILTTNVDSNHNIASNDLTTLNITQCAPEVIVVVNPKNIIYGMDTNITVTLPGDATGLINITYDNIPYSGKLVNGTVDIIVPNIEPGEHNLTVRYSGDNNYKNATSYAFFKVYNKLSFVNVSAYDIFRDENITITMTVPADATGNISVKIGNKSYNIPIKEGKANLTLSNLTPGMYIINAKI